MYADTELAYPYFQSFPFDFQHFADFDFSQKPNVSMENLMQTSSILEYDLGAEGDLFKAPETIVEEPMMSLDPMVAVMSMISCGEGVPSSQGLGEIDSSFDSGQLLSEVFYECKKDLLAKETTEAPLSEVFELKIPLTKTVENLISEEKVFSQGQFQKSVSSGNLTAMDWVHGGPVRPSFLDFPVLDFGTANGMRRAFSEGDIKTLGNRNISLIQSPLGQPQLNSCSISENRQEKLSRYRNKKLKRNFGPKIKYACRKALADSQPRIRGRFAKTEETDSSKKL
ncbi:hypothetical protein Leryth_023423 [Lithospermum erythrorhizon]|nr:hypothetical protein Leryth_023423 [Lithospermum erythrorhizon]